MFQVIGLGDQVVDKYEHQHIMYPGGNALNFAVFAAKLGVRSAFLGAFGDDMEGRFVASVLRELGIDISRCSTFEGENGCARVELRDGDRVFLGSNRCGVLRTRGLPLTAKDMDYLCGFDLIHSSAYGFSETWLEAAKRRGCRISYDFSDEFTPEKLSGTLPLVDYAVFSCSHLAPDETRRLLHDACEAGCSMALATRGSDGAYLYDGQREYRQMPSFVDAKDTMAAGDAFLTCFLITYLTRTQTDPNGTAVTYALRKAAELAAPQCHVDASFGFGQPYNNTRKESPSCSS